MSKQINTAVLGLDVGTVRVGVAVSDPLLIGAYPLETIEGNLQAKLKKIVDIARERKVSTIAVGLPYGFDGEIGESAKVVQIFVDKLIVLLNKSINTPVDVVFVDERLTSKQAEHVLSGSKLRNSDRSRAADKIAAAIILETFLQSRPK